ncbi:MAG: MOSC domain-containing protein [Thermoplasmata archaeon]|nr:MOSC domain-containing protein [Thermoplasmata archaeon]
MTTGRVLSVNTGKPRDLPWDGGVARTSIVRTPRTGRVAVGPTGLEGNEVANTVGHGTPRKRVYAYPSEHYDSWRSLLPEDPLPWGSFGENLTTEGLLESELRTGDVLAIGELRLVVTQPRFPCVNLNARFNRSDMIDRFHRAERPGFYLGVVAAGTVGAGDLVEVQPAPGPAETILEMYRARDTPPG